MSDQSLPVLPDPMIGRRIGRYVLLRQLAEGGMGAVYLATHERLVSIQKVIKLLLPSYTRNPVLRERFEREALAVSRLHHEHIVKIDDYGQLPDGQLFLMMPFLEGRPLDASLAQARTFTEHRALHIAVQICSALQYMHDLGIVHRDIKPSNIFIVQTNDNPYHVTLLDLGIAKSLADRDGVTHPGATMGTPAYMAVEQYENAGEVTPLADLYAVAIVIWEMVAGSLPWGMHSAPVLYLKQKTEPPARPPVMSEAWWKILSRALSIHPADRQQSMRELAAALASAVPAIPPHVPSGAEILARLASSFVQHAPPSAETVRNASNQERMTPILWPHRETQAPLEAASGSGGTPSPTQPRLTTLSASTGVTIAPIRRTRRTPVVLASVICLLAGVAVYALVDREARDGLRPAHQLAVRSSEISAGSTDGAADAMPLADAAPGTARVAEAPAAEPRRDALRPRTEPPRPIVKKAMAASPPALPPAVPATPQGPLSDRHRGSSSFDPDAVGGEQ
jgi:eukaryotic-like serine/threonine-protein kinase